MLRKTKIVCTLGPAVDNPYILKKTVQEGMNVARINMSHGDHEEHLKRIISLRNICRELNKNIPVLLDTKGPEIRLRKFENGAVVINQGNTFTLTSRDVLGNEHLASMTYPMLSTEVIEGDKIFIDDGQIEFKVKEIVNEDIICEIMCGGRLSDRKAINIPGKHINLPALSESDKKDLLFGINNNVEIIAPSFVRNASDIVEIREFLKENGLKTKVLIIAKIENSEGLANLKEILDASDGLLIARGDMGVELPAEEVPIIQKQIIKLCRSIGKPVITATQMLDSMTRNPRPTRAEVSDVANAVLDGTDAIMLSGETASGKYPVEAVKTMAQIAHRADNSPLAFDSSFSKKMSASNNMTDVIGHATAQVASELNCDAIITSTESGSTARLVSKYRPVCPIIAVTTNEITAKQLNLSWGLVPIIGSKSTDTDEMIENAVNTAKQAGLVKSKDRIVITAGVPVGTPGTTNMLKIHEIK